MPIQYCSMQVLALAASQSTHANGIVSGRQHSMIQFLSLHSWANKLRNKFNIVWFKFDTSTEIFRERDPDSSVRDEIEYPNNAETLQRALWMCQGISDAAICNAYRVKMSSVSLIATQSTEQNCWHPPITRSWHTLWSFILHISYRLCLRSD